MLSRAGAGEDEGTGGVVDGTLPVVNMLPLNSDRLGVGYCGLLLSMFIFCERSAARLAVGDEPRTGGGMLK